MIVSILAVTAMASMSSGFARTRGFYDQLLSQVQYARKVAIAQRRSVFVRIDAAQSRLCYEAAGPCTGVQGPDGTAPFSVPVPPGITVSAVTFQFDALGRYPSAAPLIITVTGDGSLSFTVEHESGYVHS